MSLMLILFQHVEKRRKCINWLALQSSEALMLSCFHKVMETWTQDFCSSGMREEAWEVRAQQKGMA